MSTSFIILFVVLTCFTEWSLETVVNTTESHTNSTESQSTLLQATLQSSDCLRLFASLFGRYYWVDFCDSNSYIDPYFMYYTNMICSHRSYLMTRYWIVYSRHGLRGHYIIIPPGVCVSDLRESGFWSVGSALKCVKLMEDNHHFYCHSPQITWMPIHQSPFGPPPLPDPLDDNQQIDQRDQPNNNTTTEVPLD
ncbi:unnamed protein product [Schistosoma margrebowiei]|uniref:Interleukin-4 inducing immunoglobulin-binding domain-containing protein n=1 Tax=Schistosoma margrebowiei TaxID=48269 RepID=A0AA84ZC51_9TREM|nr:unnamed protein product [Schistosoma margrebowiei]